MKQKMVYSKEKICIVVSMIALLLFDIIQLSEVCFRFGSGDLNIRWQEISCILQGYSPITTDYLPGVGKLVNDAGYMPWAYLIGTLLVGGFRDLSDAVVYSGIVFVGIGIATTVVLYKTYIKAGYKNISLMLSVLFLLQWSMISSWKSGNYGFQCCCMAIMAVCLKKRKILSGILLAISLIKPQVGGLFFITLFMEKEFIIIAVAIGVVLASWIGSSILTGVMPWTLLAQMYTMGVGFDYPQLNNGYFTILRNWNISKTLIISLSLLLGIVLCIWSVSKIQKSKAKNNLFLLYSPAALLSPIWFYYNPYDKGTMIFPIAIAIGGIFMEKELFSNKKISALFIYLNCLFGHLFWKRFFSKILLLFTMNEYLAQDISVLIEGTIYIIILCMLLRESQQGYKQIQRVDTID